MAPATASAFFVHIVGPGESLSSIAAADEPGSSASLSPSPPELAAAFSPEAGAAVPASAAASSGSYVVQPGDTLSAIAARAGLSTASLAAANGLDPTSFLISGTVLHLSGTSAATVPASTAVPVSASTTSSSYVVQPGDTLSGISARAGVSTASLAAANGLNPNAFLISGTVLHLAGGSGAVYVSAQTSSSSAASSQPVGAAAEGSPSSPPYPTPETVSAPEVGSIAAANGVPASLATAIAWQESGFNNDLVSSADARGVMQILPGTWDWIQHSLDAGPPLAPASAADNVRGGVLLLHSLLNATGGDPALAAAGYYQGLPSVQRNGVYPSTQQYVNNVLALEHHFGGG
jgi:LysM repeat protein